MTVSDRGSKSSTALVIMKVMEPRIQPNPTASRLIDSSSDTKNSDPVSSDTSTSGQSNGGHETSSSGEEVVVKNGAPQVIGDSVNNTVVSVTENEMIGRMIAVVSTADPDRDPVSLHLVPTGNTHSTFALVEGALTVARRIDYELKSKYDLTLALHDGIDFTFFNVSLLFVFRFYVLFSSASLSVLS